MTSKSRKVGELKVIKKGKFSDSGSGYVLENGVEVVDTFAEMFGMWVGRIMITAENEKWANVAARTACGFASSIIMSPAEAGIEGSILAKETPDRRPGVLIQLYHRTRPDLKNQMILRIGQCVMTCPTTAAFDALPEAKRRLKVGWSLRLFGDGFQEREIRYDRTMWRIPVMEGDFRVEERFGASKAIAGGNFIIMAEDVATGLEAAETAIAAIHEHPSGVITPFPGGICRSGSKAGSMNYKLKASTSHVFCPRLKGLVENSEVPKAVDAVYEIVINGLNEQSIRNAMAKGIAASVQVPGVLRISAGNYGGRLGPYHAYLKDVLKLT
ncbi:MAG: formylmethanofuran--tetrahydromethanopterin N-formyltransferase [Candidatus Bathyarchaeota archaeon]|nr:MAG: formylmethanofuran--tetrahydromethanopterin N-formyltransferase [Candidatus Bathyarchaeota archaeon]